MTTGEEPVATTKDGIRRAIEERLAVIERELAGLGALVVERDQLRAALAELQDPPPVTRQRRTGPAPVRPPEPQRAWEDAPSQGAQSARASRRPRGANRQAVLTFLSEQDEANAAAIADASGIDRGVIYNLLGRMADKGEVARADRDGRALYTLP